MNYNLESLHHKPGPQLPNPAAFLQDTEQNIQQLPYSWCSILHEKKMKESL